ncbi:MAG: hypothetical protein LBS10_02915 [Gracilibacteraceae bacterium]|jgi:hypothetical protein|nr:hypothetical protein [Gracilibacteraceae bacterium]
MAIRPLVFGTIAIVPYGNTARFGVYGTIAIVPYGNPPDSAYTGRLPSSPTAIRPLVFGTIAIVPYALPIVNCESLTAHQLRRPRQKPG